MSQSCWLGEKFSLGQKLFCWKPHDSSQPYRCFYETRFNAAFKTYLKYVPMEAKEGEAPLLADAGLTVLAPNAAGLFLRPDQDPVGVNTGVNGLNAAATAEPDGVRAPPAKGVSFRGPE